MLEISVLTAGRNAELLAEQAQKFQPQKVVIADESKREYLEQALSGSSIEVMAGKEALCEVVQSPELGVVLTALVGYAGLEPTLKAIEAGKDIALANKETLVVAGELVTAALKKHHAKMYPVDSEHSAIFQCLAGESENPIEKIILTASGGPFRGKDREFLSTIKKEQALKHPNWEMGAKITIDSASLMNKGLEVIEAKWLFDLQQDQIEVIVHPQSIVHSLVQFEDGSLKAQMGLPDMKLPILYALCYPQRRKAGFPRFSFMDYPQLTFEQADKKTFRNLQFAFDALEKGGNMPCILNAANEVAVAAFLKDELGFLEMSDLIADCMAKGSFVQTPTLQDYRESDSEIRVLAKEIIAKSAS